MCIWKLKGSKKTLIICSQAFIISLQLFIYLVPIFHPSAVENLFKVGYVLKLNNLNHKVKKTKSSDKIKQINSWQNIRDWKENIRT